MYNKITIIGNLGTDPEMRYMPSGDGVTSFSVATNRRYRTRDGEQRDETEWFRINVWGRDAENCNQYLEKGRLVYVEGTLSSRPWTTQDGTLRAGNEVRATTIRFLNANPPGDGEAAAPAASSAAAASAPVASEPNEPGDDLPW
ncbi:MAG: single-stranded DNA-binding protein [Dehalococcoidia bacterium]|nr:single-stranded DNA-binding protein [Dehalococcoidia bacterium]